MISESIGLVITIFCLRKIALDPVFAMHWFLIDSDIFECFGIDGGPRVCFFGSVINDEINQNFYCLECS